MSVNVFESEYEETILKLRRLIWKNRLLKFFSLGIINWDREIKLLKLSLIQININLLKYKDVLTRTDLLENSDSIIELCNVRTGTSTFSNTKVILKGDYGSNWDIIRQSILSRDDYQCQESDGLCNGALHVHHIRTLLNGGTNESNNLITLCEYHHSLKHEHMKRNL